MVIEELMDRDLTALTEDASLAEAIEVLSIHRISSAPVVDLDGKVVGILSEKDIVRAALPGYFELLQDPTFIPDLGQFRFRLRRVSREAVKKYMTKKVITFTENDSDFHVAMIMIKNNIKRAPVVRDGALAGMINRADLLQHLMSEGKDDA